MTSKAKACPKPLPIDAHATCVAMGIEGSANKLGVGIVRWEWDGTSRSGKCTILSNPRKTYVTPPGEGFLPRETAWHHQSHVVALVRAALEQAELRPEDLDCLCYTRGPG